MRRFPRHAIEYCLAHAGIRMDGVDFVVFYEKPLLKFERLLETYLAFAPRGFRSFTMAIPLWVREKLFQRSLLAKELRKFGPAADFGKTAALQRAPPQPRRQRLLPFALRRSRGPHHGWRGRMGHHVRRDGQRHQLEILREIHFPHSLGLFYSAFTYYTGFRVNSGEYKLMGLAPYGTPRYASLIRDNLIDLKPDGSFRLNLDYFDYCTGLRMTNRRFDKLFGSPPRQPEDPLTEFHMDIAASAQLVLDDAVLALTRGLAADTGAENLCLAGGVALNCVVQRKGAARWALQALVDSTRRGRRRRSLGRGARGLSSAQEPATFRHRCCRFDAGLVPRSELSSSPKSSAACVPPERASAWCLKTSC